MIEILAATSRSMITLGLMGTALKLDEFFNTLCIVLYCTSNCPYDDSNLERRIDL